jgi:hypothetical protein
MERNKAYYQLGIYKEKFKEYELATKSWSSCCKTVLKKINSFPMYNIRYTKSQIAAKRKQ